MNIEQFNREKAGFFKASENGVDAGRMTYTWRSETVFSIDHTEVDPAFSGKGVGLKMVEAALNFARENNLKIIPLCPYAKAQFDRHADWSDVLFQQ